MTDRDTFAAAALAGLLAQGDDGSFSEESYVRAAYRWSDAMLDFRDSRIAKETNHDAAPAARATADRYVRRAAADVGGDRTDKAAPQPCEGTGDISEAQIDALECVVEDGRIVGMSVYGHLRSLLVRLRPEWEGESDRSKPISDERLRSTGGTVGFGSTGGEMMSNPIAYAAIAADGSESVYVASLREQAEACCRENGWFLVPLYAAPPTWQQEVAAVEDAFERSGVKPTWPDDEPGNIGPMAAAMADEIACLRLTVSERQTLKAVIRALRTTDYDVEYVALQKMLERLSGTGDTPPPHATPPQGSVLGDSSVPRSGTENEPVAWGVADPEGRFRALCFARDDAFIEKRSASEKIVPLYRYPQPTLTNEEREAVERVCVAYELLPTAWAKQVADTLSKLLERTK